MPVVCAALDVPNHEQFPVPERSILSKLLVIY
jgi:hypothetical protein